MQITESALKKLKSFVPSDTDNLDGVRITESSGCCGPSIGMILVHQPEKDDITEVHDGIKFYLDILFKDFSQQLKIDFDDEYFKISGLEGFNNSCCG